MNITGYTESNGLPAHSVISESVSFERFTPCTSPKCAMTSLVINPFGSRRQDDLIDPGQPALRLPDHLRIKTGIDIVRAPRSALGAIPGTVFSRAPGPGYGTRRYCSPPGVFIAQVFIHLRLQRQRLLGERVEQPAWGDQRR